MSLRKKIIFMVKDKKKSPVHETYRSIHSINDTMVGDVLIDLNDPTIVGYVISEQKNWKTVLWNNNKLVAYKKDNTEDFAVRHLRNVSLPHLFRWLVQ